MEYYYYRRAFVGLLCAIILCAILHAQENSADSDKSCDVGNENVIFTKDELKTMYNASNPTGRGIYLAILGEVFDVTAGEEFYGEGKGYAAFSGRDGSRSFVTGNFSEAGMSEAESLEGLSAAEVAGVVGWRTFYRKEEKYPFVGYLVGLYFDENGEKKSSHAWVEAKLSEHENKERRRAILKSKYPRCNSQWTQDTGKRLWCSEKHLVPRKFNDTMGSSTRCACVDIDSFDRSDGVIEAYADCPPTSNECKGL